MSVRFVGRRTELEVVGALVRRARLDRAPAAALLTGEPGSGKTTLLAETVARAAPTHVVHVGGFEPMQSVPLAAVSELLRMLARVPRDGAALDRLVFQAPDSQDHDPLRIFEAAHRALGPQGPMLISIDDLQWVDERSIALVHYLLRAAASGHQSLVVVAAARWSPAAASYRTSLEADLAPDRRAFLDLGPLSLEDGRSLAQAIDRGLDDAAATDLWRRAGGSPFWVDALARGGASADPSSLIAARLRDLSSDAGALLAVIAVGGRPFMDEDAAELLDWGADRVRQAIQELVGRGLAIRSDGSTRVAHDLIREAATRALPAEPRRRLHARIAAWIEDRAGDDLPLLREALVHRGGAGLPAGALAGRLLASSQRRLLNVDDLRLLTATADALESTDPKRLELDRSLAEVAAVTGEQEIALDRWARVSEAAVGGPERQHAEIEAAQAAYRLARSAEAHRHLDRARQAAPANGATAVQMNALEAEVELWLDHETVAGSQNAALALEGARAMVTAIGDIDGLSPEDRRAYLAALIVAGDAALQGDRADEVIEHSEAIIRVAQGLDDASHTAALIRTGFALRPLGRIRESEAFYRSAWERSKSLVLPILTVEAGHGLARGLRDLGRLVEARAIATETGRLEARIRNAPRRWGSAASIVHAIELSLGEATSALRALRRDADTEPDPHYRLAIHQTVAAWQARSAGTAAAGVVEAELAAARADSAVARCPRCAAELAIVSVELLARIGRTDEARGTLAEWDRATAGRTYLQRALWRMRAGAAIAVADGDAAAAIAILEQYASELERAGYAGDLLWARIDLGRVLAKTDRVRSVAAFTTAAELAAQIGASSEGRLVAQALRRLGVRAWRRGPAAAEDGLAGLSEREAEVSRLVADGLSNREIAEALVVSPKTVERHVTNVLAKLGLRNRTEMASVIRSGRVRGLPDE
ncbi:MAG: AAA family ATPase [Chloroflexi bacterium]|nr:AAA family ATPase [Chloroflexota bacterium]